MVGRLNIRLLVDHGGDRKIAVGRLVKFLQNIVFCLEKRLFLHEFLLQFFQLLLVIDALLCTTALLAHFNNTK